MKMLSNENLAKYAKIGTKYGITFDFMHLIEHFKYLIDCY